MDEKLKVLLELAELTNSRLTIVENINAQVLRILTRGAPQEIEQIHLSEQADAHRQEVNREIAKLRGLFGFGNQ